MEIRKNECLKKYTTLKIGGIAENFYMVESTQDIIDVFKETNGEVLILGKGSNLLINDRKKFKHVINMTNYEKILEHENGITTVSASIKIQKLINFINQHNRGGIEYLYSVPCTLGGAIYMNAGRGKSFNKSISDYVVNVTVYDGEKIMTLSKDECHFSYRNSIFKSKNWIILSAQFQFPEMQKEESTKLKKERIELCKNVQDSRYSNAGSCFRVSDGRIMNMLRKLKLGWSKGVCFSGKTSNWLNNYGDGTYKQAITLINFTKFLHKILFRKIELEYIVWD